MSNLQSIREKKGMSREAVADRAGCSFANIYKLETEGSTPRLDMARAIANALGVDLDAVFPPTAKESR